MGVLRTVIGLIMCEGERQEDFLVGHFPFITKKKSVVKDTQGMFDVLHNQFYF